MRQDQFTIHVMLHDAISGRDCNLGVWDKLSGGGVDSTETKYHPGNGSQEITIGGARTTENVTVLKLCIRDTDGVAMQQWMALCGRARATVTIVYLTPDYDPSGAPNLVYTGQLKKVTPPAPDSNATGAALVGLEISVAGLPA